MTRTPLDYLQQQTQQLLDDTGWQATVYNYTKDTTDGAEWYEETTDTEWVEDDGTTATIRVEPINVNYQNDESGTRLSGQATVYVQPDVPISDGVGEDERASEIVDETTGVRYEVRAQRVQHNGTIRLRCIRLE